MVNANIRLLDYKSLIYFCFISFFFCFEKCLFLDKNLDTKVENSNIKGLVAESTNYEHERICLFAKALDIVSV